MNEDPKRLEDLPAFAGSLSGQSEAALHMHAEARVALLNLLLTDPEVSVLFQRWTQETPLGRLAATIGELLERTAIELGFPSAPAFIDAIATAPDHTLTLTVSLDVVDDTEASQLRNALEQTLNDRIETVEDLTDELVDAIRQSGLTPMTADAIALVRDRWQLPWPWPVWDLLSMWSNWVANAPWGKKTIVEYWAEPSLWAGHQRAPSIAFATMPGETIDEALQRCYDEVVGPMLAVAAVAPLPKGKQSNPEIVQRYVGWWYRKVIRGESVNRIARDVAAERGMEGDLRRHVRYGIGQAYGWLGAVSWVWRDDIEN